MARTRSRHFCSPTDAGIEWGSRIACHHALEHDRLEYGRRQRAMPAVCTKDDSETSSSIVSLLVHQRSERGNDTHTGMSSADRETVRLPSGKLTSMSMGRGKKEHKGPEVRSSKFGVMDGFWRAFRFGRAIRQTRHCERDSAHFLCKSFEVCCLPYSSFISQLLFGPDHRTVPSS